MSRAICTGGKCPDRGVVLCEVEEIWGTLCTIRRQAKQTKC